MKPPPSIMLTCWLMIVLIFIDDFFGVVGSDVHGGSTVGRCWALDGGMSTRVRALSLYCFAHPLLTDAPNVRCLTSRGNSRQGVWSDPAAELPVVRFFLSTSGREFGILAEGVALFFESR